MPDTMAGPHWWIDPDIDEEWNLVEALVYIARAIDANTRAVEGVTEALNRLPVGPA